MLSDYPLDRPVKLIEASALAAVATSKSVATDQRIEQAIAQLEKLGEVTLKAIARLVKTSFGRISKSAAWKAYRQRVSGWFVDFPNAINNISTRKNHKPPANQDPEPPPPLQTSTEVDNAENGESSAPIATPQVSQSLPIVIEAQDEAWGIGLVRSGAVVECFGRAGLWTIKYCTGVVAKVSNYYGREEIVSCKHLRLAGIAA
jgi:hypothetical protein